MAIYNLTTTFILDEDASQIDIDTGSISSLVPWTLHATLQDGPTRRPRSILPVYAHLAIRRHVSQPIPQTRLRKPLPLAVQRKLVLESTSHRLDLYRWDMTGKKNVCPGRSYECAATNDVLGCHTSIHGGWSQLMTVMNSDFSSVSTIKTELIGGYINAYGVQIHFQASDLQPVTTPVSAEPTSSLSAATV